MGLPTPHLAVGPGNPCSVQQLSFRGGTTRNLLFLASRSFVREIRSRTRSRGYLIRCTDASPAALPRSQSLIPPCILLRGPSFLAGAWRPSVAPRAGSGDPRTARRLTADNCQLPTANSASQKRCRRRWGVLGKGVWRKNEVTYGPGVLCSDGVLATHRPTCSSARPTFYPAPREPSSGSGGRPGLPPAVRRPR